MNTISFWSTPALHATHTLQRVGEEGIHTVALYSTLTLIHARHPHRHIATCASEVLHGALPKPHSAPVSIRIMSAIHPLLRLRIISKSSTNPRHIATCAHLKSSMVLSHGPTPPQCQPGSCQPVIHDTASESESCQQVIR